eukprot:TRINITY_DN1710_c0_g1_i1.p1 TRINITY_DN1710_c0_g1~~TRINITY_DN1710_c0_g1_i1.p1  ORF type:complete len:243 (-),score=58.16 TRINITY_DN1710_c0_g1_i1:77-805(-)
MSPRGIRYMPLVGDLPDDMTTESPQIPTAATNDTQLSDMTTDVDPENIEDEAMNWTVSMSPSHYQYDLAPPTDQNFDSSFPNESNDDMTCLGQESEESKHSEQIPPSLYLTKQIPAALSQNELHELYDSPLVDAAGCEYYYSDDSNAADRMFDLVKDNPLGENLHFGFENFDFAQVEGCFMDEVHPQTSDSHLISTPKCELLPTLQQTDNLRIGELNFVENMNISEDSVVEEQDNCEIDDKK